MHDKAWKKKVELPQNKQTFSSVSGSLERIKQAFLSWSYWRTFMLTSASLPICAAGFYTSTSGGHSNFRFLTKYLCKRRPGNPSPAEGRGSSQIWMCLQTITLSLRGRELKHGRWQFHRERPRELSCSVNMPMRRMPLLVRWKLGTRGPICGAPGKASTQRELATFCWSLGGWFGTQLNFLFFVKIYFIDFL